MYTFPFHEHALPLDSGSQTLLSRLTSTRVTHTIMMTDVWVRCSLPPDWAASLSQLSFLFAGSNNFSGALPTGFNSSLEGSGGLRLLDLSNNSFSGR